MTLFYESTPKRRHVSLREQAHAFALVLREEFDESFSIYEAATGERLQQREPDLGCERWEERDRSLAAEIAKEKKKKEKQIGRASCRERV